MHFLQDSAESLETLLINIKNEPHLLPEISLLTDSLFAADAKMRLRLLKRCNELGTVLHALASLNCLEYMECILYSVNSSSVFGLLRIPDDGGRTPLHFAAYHGYLDLLELMIESVINEKDRLHVLTVEDAVRCSTLDYLVNNCKNRYEYIRDSDIIYRFLNERQQREIQKALSAAYSDSKVESSLKDSRDGNYYLYTS